MTARAAILRALTDPKQRGVCYAPDSAEQLLNAYRAEVLHQAADALEAACPDGDAEETLLDCPCTVADELRHMADTTTGGTR